VLRITHKTGVDKVGVKTLIEMPEILRSIIIRNLRGFEQLELKNLGKLNLIVGRNGTGKSTVLEAITLAASASTNFYDSLGNDLLEWLIKRRGKPYVASLNHIIRIGRDQAEILVRSDRKSVFSVSLATRHAAERIISQYVEKDKEKYERYIGILNNMDKEVTRVVRRIIRRRQGFVWRVYEVEEEISTVLYVLANGMPMARLSVLEEDYPHVVRYTPGSTANSSVLVFDEILGFSMEFYASVHDALLKSGRIEKIREVLGKRGITDIRLDRGGVLHVMIEDKYLPINVVGDGTRLLVTELALILLKPSILIAEEPEIHLHPGYIDLFVKAMVEMLREGTDSQAFISTHSLDLIDSVIKFVRGSGLEDEFKVVRMLTLREVEILDYEETLRELNEIKVDLRGV